MITENVFIQRYVVMRLPISGSKNRISYKGESLYECLEEALRVSLRNKYIYKYY